MTAPELESKPRLLVVDDNEMNRDMLSRRLARRGYVVASAESGFEALDMVAEDPPALILLDIMMPELDGYDVLQRIREHHDRANLPIIMVTAKEESEDIVRALEGGANDYVTKPVDFAVALARIETQLLLRTSQQLLLAANQRMRADLESAARVQEALLPDPPPGGSPLYWAYHFRPCDELGGDLVNAFQVGSDHVGFFLLDVSGHGVASALLSVAINRSLSPVRRATSLLYDDNGGLVSPDRIAAGLNRSYPLLDNGGMFFTALVGIFDRCSGEVEITSAGHHDPVLMRADGSVEAQPVDGGPPIGVTEDAEFGYSRFSLAPGERLLLCSDGLLEQPDGSGSRYGMERLLVALGEAPRTDLPMTLEHCMTAWHAFRGDIPVKDDVSVLALETRENADP